MRLPVLIFLFIWTKCCSATEYSITNSLRELAGGAFLSSWPVGARDIVNNNVEKAFQYANNMDADDCGKKLLCQLAGKKSRTKLSWDEELLLGAFDNQITYTSSSVQFKVAVQVGLNNAENCVNVYSRCNLDLQQMLEMLRRQGISFEIPGQEKDCAVYFLWKKKGKKKDNITDNVLNVE